MDDFYDDYDDFDEGFENDECESDADEFEQSPTDAGSNDGGGMDWDDFTLGMGLGYELGYGERRKRRKDPDDF